jgi:hypothetical protein
MDIIDSEDEGLLSMAPRGLVGGYQGFRGTCMSVLHVIWQKTVVFMCTAVRTSSRVNFIYRLYVLIELRLNNTLRHVSTTYIHWVQHRA